MTNYEIQFSPRLVDRNGEICLKDPQDELKGKVMYFDTDGKLKASGKSIANISDQSASTQEFDSFLFALIF